MLRFASAASALCALALLPLAPFEAAAKSGGVAARSGGAHFGVRALHRGAHPRAYSAFKAHRRLPLIGGAIAAAPYYGYPYYGYDGAPGYPSGYGDDVPPVAIVAPPAPPRVLTCQRRQETVTVPSVYGGTREITITRC